MKIGDLVTWKFQRDSGLPTEIGVIISYIGYEERGRDPFPWWRVVMSDRGVLRCRETDLIEV
jgi:hypothetical protein